MATIAMDKIARNEKYLKRKTLFIGLFDKMARNAWRYVIRFSTRLSFIKDEIRRFKIQNITAYRLPLTSVVFRYHIRGLLRFGSVRFKQKGQFEFGWFWKIIIIIVIIIFLLFLSFSFFHVRVHLILWCVSNNRTQNETPKCEKNYYCTKCWWCVWSNFKVIKAGCQKHSFWSINGKIELKQPNKLSLLKILFSNLTTTTWALFSFWIGRIASNRRRKNGKIESSICISKEKYNNNNHCWNCILILADKIAMFNFDDIHSLSTLK